MRDPGSAEGLRKRLSALEDEVARLRDVESRLRQSEELFRAAFRTSPDAVNLNRLSDGLYLDVNDGFQALTGYGRHEVLGRTSVEVGLWVDGTKRERVVEMLVRDGEVRGLDAELRRKDGTLVTASVSARLLNIAGVPHVLSVTRDVGERRRAAAALAESEERYRSLVERTRDGFFMIEAGTGRFLFLNQAICDLCGYSPAEGLRMTVWDVVTPEEHNAVRERFQSQLAGAAPLPLRVWQMVRKDGSTFRAEISASGVTFQGRPVIQGLLRDVTERERLLERLSQSQKLEAVGTLASGIAHDFNNILQAISGYAELFLSGRGSVEERRNYVLQISRSADRAAELIRGLLAFSRRVEPKLCPLDVNLVIDQAVRVLARTLPRMITIETVLAADLWPVRGDHSQLELVLLNLGINARDAMPQGGRLKIETRNVEVAPDDAGCHAQVPGPHVLVQVCDEGHGMDQNTLAQVFDPFFTTKAVGQGTGLGLSLVYGIAQGHRGFVTCRSVPGRGSTFELFLPATVHRLVQETASPRVAPPRGGGEVLLVVDDEEAVLAVVAEFLGEIGYRVLTARSGEEALERYAETGGAVALAILDLDMSGMGGMECLSRLRAQDGALRVLVASGHPGDIHARLAREAGAAGFVAKPYSLAELATQVRDSLEGD